MAINHNPTGAVYDYDRAVWNIITGHKKTMRLDVNMRIVYDLRFNYPDIYIFNISAE